MAVKVTLREKKISKGRKSLYLDFYPAIRNPNTGKDTRREFLGLYVTERAKSPAETQHNKDTRRIAESIRNQRFLEIQNNTYGFQSDAKRKKSFVDFYQLMVNQRYTSEGNYGNWRSSFLYFSEYFENGLTMGDLSQQVLEEYRDHLISLDLAQNTKHTYFAKLVATVKAAYKKAYIPENYANRVDSIKAEETRREFVTLEELKVLANTESDCPKLKTAFLFSALTGLRFSDIMKLNWEDLQGNEESGYFIRYQQKKTKETLPIPLPARKLMGEKGEPEQQIFKGLKYSAWENEKMKRWILAAGIKRKITFHAARHSFATIQLTLGTDIYTVSKILGHKSIRTTQIYGKVVDEMKTAAMNKFNDLEL